ncbi:hypothetical protein HanXRQr2_Chr11g0480361 [Helianthus annuus]|uniref:Uncharacterized protein n=1 Tax=Helianthus annuus TaxID=4232 RepID=A0A9K3HMW9_HELAN|nr:hypothetical protein HanXRQr2_Chr11g0480361 [Helianthus annuus]
MNEKHNLDARFNVRYRKMIKLNEEPNTIKNQASANCFVVMF